MGLNQAAEIARLTADNEVLLREITEANKLISKLTKAFLKYCSCRHEAIAAELEQAAAQIALLEAAHSFLDRVEKRQEENEE